jgi:glycosyltransferase involved in cell wall biosynthesis
MPHEPTFFYVVGDTVRNPGRSGIQSVVRSLGTAFGARAAAGRHSPAVHPVVWNAGRRYFCPLPPRLSLGLGAEPLREPPGTPWLQLLRQPVAWPAWALARGHSGDVPLHFHPRYRGQLRGGWLLLPELAYRGRAALFIDYAHRHGLRVAVIFHDAIPIQHPEYVPPDLPADHADYMRALSRADLILPNSEASAEGWREFVEKEKLPQPAVRVCTLASEIPGAERVRQIAANGTRNAGATAGAGQRAASAGIRMLCVSTIEPRKNHRTLLAAFDLAVAQRPDLGLKLDLAGASYVGSGDLMSLVHHAMRRHRGALHWHEKVEHSFLRQLFEACDFTIYPSVVEGFGLPVIESLWFGRPCICANFSVMAENAAGGGCLTTDVRNPKDLAAAILQLADSPDLRRKLAAEAVSRPLKSWADYAEEVSEAMTTL